MTGQFKLSPRATADLHDIWNYTALRWDVDQAETYISRIQLAVTAIADEPHRGRACDDVRIGYRRYPVGSHVLCYRVAGRDVVIVRILHRRMDPHRHV